MPSRPNELRLSPSGRKVRATTAAEEVVDRVKADLFAGRIKPGESLGSEKQLCERFGISRFTVREAIRLLEALGMAETRRGKTGGVWIAHPNPYRFAEALAVQLELAEISQTEVADVHLAIETEAVRTIIAGPPGPVEELRAYVATLREAATEAPPLANDQLLGFYLRLVSLSGNRVLLALAQALHHMALRDLPDTVKSAREPIILDTLDAIVDAIEHRDITRAEALLRGHFMGFRSLEGAAAARG